MTTAQFYALPEDEREYQIADWELAQQECKQHGGPLSECGDPDKVWYPQMLVCYATMERASAQKRWELKHGKREWHNGDFTSWSETPDAQHPIHRDAGVNIFVTPTDLGIGGDFLSSAPKKSED